MGNVRFVGLDVHAATIAVAVAEAGGEIRSLGMIPNRPEAIRKLVHKLGPVDTLRVCYEAGPTGYVLYWQLVGLDVHCDVVAPSLVPVKAGDRVKTDRRDAEKLARCYRAGDLTPVWVPDAAHEALRDLVRVREAAKKDQLRARHRLGKFLLRQGRHRPAHLKMAWTAGHIDWIRALRFDSPLHQIVLADSLHEVARAATRIADLNTAILEAVRSAPPQMRAVIQALQALRGVATVSAATIVAEVGQLSRFPNPRQLMGYSGLVPSEYTTGARRRLGAITKTGNAHLRRVVIEAAWAYRFAPAVRAPLRARQAGLDPRITEIAWRAQKRLHDRHRTLTAKGKNAGLIVTAIGRELLGFMWDIGRTVEAEIPVVPTA
jgi:transposase